MGMPRPRIAMLCLFAVVLAGSARGGDAPIFRVFAWSDYFAPEILAAFEDRHGCVVAIDAFDSNESMLETLDSDENDFAYDIITPSSYMTDIMRRRGMLRRLDHSLIPNLPNLDETFTELTADPDLVFSVPYTRTVTGVGINALRLGGHPRSWSVFGNPAFAGRMTMLDDMRETMGAALKFLGHSLNSLDPAHLAEAERLLLDWRRNLARFEVDESGVGLGTGELDAAHAYNGDVAVLMEENPDIDFFVPMEGAAITSDDFVIPAGAANPELAHAFIDHLLDPANAAANMEAIMYFMPVPEAVAMLGESIRANHAFAVSDEILAKSEVIRDLGDDTRLYEEVWERVTAGE